MTIAEAMQTIAVSSDLTARQESDSLWSLFETGKDKSELAGALFRTDLVDVDSLGLISAHLHNVSLKHIIPEVFSKLGLDYFLIGKIDNNVSVDVNKIRIGPFLGVLFTGTTITWRESDGVYIIGDIKDRGPMSSVAVYPMKYWNS